MESFLVIKDIPNKELEQLLVNIVSIVSVAKLFTFTIDESLFYKSVEELEITVRSASALQRCGIKTVGELIQLTEKELLSVHNFGKVSLADLVGELSKFGLVLGMKVRKVC